MAIEDGGSPPCSISPPVTWRHSPHDTPALPGRKWRTTEIPISIFRRPKEKKKLLRNAIAETKHKILASPCRCSYLSI